MANNRLYIVDAETNEQFLLAKSSGTGWHVFDMNEHGVDDPAAFVRKLGEFLNERDTEASYGNPSNMKSTKLVLKTEYDINN